MFEIKVDSTCTHKIIIINELKMKVINCIAIDNNYSQCKCLNVNFC